jgi:GNAT superfamily N-acetyltransferase
MDLSARPATAADVPALVVLQQAFDTRWFGVPEQDEAEVRESLARVSPLEQRSVLLHDGGRLVAAGWWWKPDDSTLLVDPDVGDPGVHDALVGWLVSSGAVGAEALAGDELLRAALVRHGWAHRLSQFELIRDSTGLPAPTWLGDVSVTSLGDEAEAVHRLIYREARWADVPGHGHRPLAEWHGLFLAGEDPAQQVLAWRDGTLVGVALGKTFSDGTGWVSQVAVRPDQQGRGLGRALLLEAFGRRLASGATRLGLGVSAANGDALRLYESIGLRIDREWMLYQPGG